MFYSLPGGLQRLVGAVVARIDIEVHLGTPVWGCPPVVPATSSPPPRARSRPTPWCSPRRLRRRPAPRRRRSRRGGDPAPSTTRRSPSSPWPSPPCGRAPLDASGYLVPAPGLPHHRLHLGLGQWAHLAAPGGSCCRRPPVATATRRIADLDDDQLVAAVRGTGTTMGLDAEPSAVRVVRWTRLVPQYVPGHLQRMAMTSRPASPQTHPGIALAGAVLRRGHPRPASAGPGRGGQGRGATGRAALARRRSPVLSGDDVGPGAALSTRRRDRPVDGRQPGDPRPALRRRRRLPRPLGAALRLVAPLAFLGIFQLDRLIAGQPPSAGSAAPGSSAPPGSTDDALDGRPHRPRLRRRVRHLRRHFGAAVALVPANRWRWLAPARRLRAG